MKVSDYVINFLVSNNITHVFEICGGAITHLLDSLYARKDITAISLHHEQAAAFAAEGYSRAGDKIGVAMATSGPGATNLITGIASCFFDSLPCLFITGQVNTYEFKFSRPLRQLGFQETDIVKIVKPIVKEAIIVTDAKKIKYYLQKAVCIAKSGRPGPVLLDIPMDIQRARINPRKLESFSAKQGRSPSYKLDKPKIKEIARLINSSSRPVVLAGAGVRLSGGQDAFLKFIKNTGIPVVTSLMGLDILPYDNPSFVGMIGIYGNRYANLTIANADLVLALGTRLDTRQTGNRPDNFARGAKIIHVDIDPHELNNKLKADLSINADIKMFLRSLNGYFTGFKKVRLKRWKNKIEDYKKKYPAYKLSFRMDDSICPDLFIRRLSHFISDDSIICVDVGQNQMWSAKNLELKKDQRFITQGGMAAMGSALSLAIGASFAKPKSKIVCISGDGGFQLNIQELQTVYQHKLPIKIILLNNNCYGMVRQFQEQYFQGRFQSTVIGYSAPVFQDIACAYKIPAKKISFNSEIENVLRSFFKPAGPGFLEVMIKKESMVLPKLSVNKPVEDQEPFLSRDELKSNMFIDILPENKDEKRKKH
jgi:acetolactate synthase-1/2/3 large subunit